MKIFICSVLLFFFFGLATSQAQSRTDLPLYNVEQERKQQVLSLLNHLLQRHEGIQLGYDSLQKTIRQDSTQRYNNLKKPKTLQYGNRKVYRND
jgi:hypothetical protein